MIYKTKQKNNIENSIKSLNKDFEIKDIYQDLKKEVGLTTIYRYVDKLVNEGIVKKIDDTHYQYLEECTEENHFYLKCNKCKRLIHIDCDCIKELTNHISKEHNFILDNKNILMNGLCEDCSKEERKC